MYRFLLRMPHHLREQLKTSADRSGRSLNAELVYRLERSIARDAGMYARLRSLLIISRRTRMASKSNHQRAWRGLAVRAGAALGLIAVALVAAMLLSNSSSQTAVPAPAGSAEEGVLSPALKAKLAAGQRFSPGETQYEAGEAIGGGEVGDGAQDWYMHSAPGTDIPLAAISGSRQDWKELESRSGSSGLHAGGHFRNLGPDNAVYPLNPFRNRYVYVPNEYIAAGRTAFAVIDPNCDKKKCRYWIANAGGGIWRTENVFAAQPKWDFLSDDFQHNNTAALELDPNDSKSKVLYAGTGEPNTCRSGCIAGVGMYKSVNVGAPVRTLSLRKNLVVSVPPPPAPTYIRVLPFASFTTSNSSRSTPAPVAGSRGAASGAKICVHVPGAPFAFERQMPFAKKDA